MKHLHVCLLGVVIVVGSAPAFAQKGHPGGGPPAGVGGGASSSHGAAAGMDRGSNASMGHADMMHASPGAVLGHNTAIAGKIKTLTGEEASKACDGFKNLGQCVAAAHVAKNLDIKGGFDALRGKMTGKGGVSLGKAIEELEPNANAKAESKKANRQAKDDMDEAGS